MTYLVIIGEIACLALSYGVVELVLMLTVPGILCSSELSVAG
jgi:hypothetical protein